MNKNYLFLTILFQLFTSKPALAAHTGAPSFTEEERVRHEEGLDKILNAASACLERDMERHSSFFKRYGISAYYGDRSVFGKLSYSGKKNYLKSIGQSPNLVEKMEPTSCVGLTLKCLGEGFREAGQEDLWQRLKQYTMINGVDGTALQDGLQRLGWKIQIGRAHV